MSRRGVGYLGSNKIETSVANQEIIDSPPSHWSHGYSLYKMSYLNRDSCTVIINGKTEIYLEAGQGFEMNENDAPITSFVIKETGIRYTFIGAW